ncbi:uncharacterized protein LOC121369881, partial [Gigantopelta aegis]|uniref:uncharacterized protein LOC121369881 n=1 Tax=Gigantopelta aegis TaxID=1735272 RepID=UPI001B888F9C
CPHGLPPEGGRVQPNRLKGDQPLYWLDVGAVKYGFAPGHTYSLNVLASDPLRPFSDAILTIHPEETSQCGSGSFELDTSDLYQPTHCPGVLITNRKQPMQMLPSFLWKAPDCGCVLVRATVIRDGSVYYRDKSSTSGHLSRRICLKYAKDDLTTVSAKRFLQRTNIKGSPSEPVMSPPNPRTTAVVKEKTPRRERVNLLCDLSVEYDGADLLRRKVFLKRRGLKHLTSIQLIRLELAINQRIRDIRQCCALQPSEARQECVDDIRRRRIDQFCGDGHPDVPFTTDNTDFMKQREKKRVAGG